MIFYRKLDVFGAVPVRKKMKFLPSREETKSSGANNGDREVFIFLVQLADHEQDCQPYPVDPYPY